MSTAPLKPQNLPETLIWYYIIGTYLIYYLGAQYVLAQLLAFFLTLYLIQQWWNQTEETPLDERISISPSVWVWIVAVLVLESATAVSHYNFDMGLKRFIETSVAWSRTWALFALFPLVGHLKIRPKLIYRAICILCLQSLVIVIIGSLAGLIHLPNITYISPLGSLPLNGGIKQYEVYLFHNPINERLQLFAPWPPALGVTSNIYFFLVLQEQNKKWRWISIVSIIAMIVGSVSRTAIICLPFVVLFVWAVTNLLRPWVQFVAGGISFLSGIYLPTLIEFLKASIEELKKARAKSSKTRDALERIAVHRWETEAPIWGHGLSEPGPPWVARMPIGTHHTWFGLLFTHGLVGCVAFATALAWSFIDLLIKAQSSENARVGLKIILVLIIFSFSEHLDGSVYVFWPGLVMLGIAFKEGQALHHYPKMQSIT
ncbi:MAG: O-antigen ligase family protein [Coleofasciculus sp. S288]|nr:O-antigen ligase family protein [Coleofasciculus sp. S288]